MRYYDDNYGEYDTGDPEETREFYRAVQNDSELKKCSRCDEEVMLRTHYDKCNSCMEKIEGGMEW